MCTMMTSHFNMFIKWLYFEHGNWCTWHDYLWNCKMFISSKLLTYQYLVMKPSRQHVMFWIITSQNHSSIKPLNKHPLGGSKMILIFAHLACNLWVHVHILVHQCGKMDAKTSKCILLGWDDYTEGYHCYCPFIREIIISKFIVIHQKHCYHKISNFKKTWSFFKSMHICTNAWLEKKILTNNYWDIVYVVNLVSWITSLVGSLQNDWVYYLLHQRYTQLWFILQKLQLFSSHQI
jgi:hypothetical protein